MGQGAIVTIITALLAFAGGLLGAVFIFKGKKLDNVYIRLSQVEKKEEKCREDLFDMKQELQGFYLITDIMLQTYPEAEAEVKKVRDRIMARRKERASHREQGGHQGDPQKEP